MLRHQSKHMNIDYSVLNDIIKMCMSDDVNAEDIATTLVECGNVDMAFGHLIFDENGEYLPGGVELDRQILGGLRAYVSSVINTEVTGNCV